MEEPIAFTALNDFLFCPASLFYHNMYMDVDKIVYQDVPQVAGSNAHMTIDKGIYATKKDILQGISAYSSRFGLFGKIDKFIISSGRLVESKKKVTHIFDGYVFQLYAECVSLEDMGYHVKEMEIYSIDDNRRYPIALPNEDPVTFQRFIELLSAIQAFDLRSFKGSEPQKCKCCIYSPACEWGDPNA